jgi:hypothetical protein
VTDLINVILDNVAQQNKLMNPPETAKMMFFNVQKWSHKRMFSYKNVDKPITDPVKCFMIERSSKMANRIKRNLKTRSQSWNEFVETVDFLFEVPNLKTISKEELVMQNQFIKNVPSTGDDSDIYCF